MRMQFNDILICDDHAVCRVGIDAVLKHSYEKTVATRMVASGRGALDLIKQKIPDLIIIDLGLPDMHGLEVIKHIRDISQTVKILVLTGCDHAATLNQAIKYKVNALLQKTYSVEHIKDVLSILEISENKIYIDPTIEKIFEENKSTSLTKREYEILDLISKGHTTKEIAELLVCSSETVKTHRSNIMNKISARNIAEMTAWYLDGNTKAYSGADT